MCKFLLFCVNYFCSNIRDETIVDFDSFCLETNLQAAKNGGSKGKYCSKLFYIKQDYCENNNCYVHHGTILTLNVEM